VTNLEAEETAVAAYVEWLKEALRLRELFLDAGLPLPDRLRRVLDDSGAAIAGGKVEACLSGSCTVSILTRVNVCAAVEALVRWRLRVTGNPEQAPEGVERVEPPIEPERELVAVGL